MKKKLIISGVLLLGLYVCTYIALRQMHVEIWERDGHAYVLFPNGLTYYFYRPLTYPDAMITGMRFHIGPHR